MKYLKKIKSGFSLIELLLAFAIIMLIVVSAFFIYKNVKSKSEVNEIVTVLQNVSSNIKTLFGNAQRDAGGILAMTEAENDFVFKQDFPRGIESSPLGGDVYKRKNFFVMPTNQVLLQNYTVVSFGLVLPTSECPEVVSQLMATGNYITGVSAYYAKVGSQGENYLLKDGMKPITKFSPTVYQKICTENDISSVLKNYSSISLAVVY